MRHGGAGAVELRRELCSHTGLDLPATFVWDYPTADDMTAFIVQQLPSTPATAQAAAVHCASESGSQPADAVAQNPTAVAGPSCLALQPDEREAFVSQQVKWHCLRSLCSNWADLYAVIGHSLELLGHLL